MNAKKHTSLSIRLASTALALCGALALSAGCAGGDGDGSGGSGGGGGGEGGSGGGGGGCTPGDGEICFSIGKAQGVAQGYGYIALGTLDTATSPVCDDTENGRGASEPITKEQPCPEQGGKTVWSSESALCISGSIPIVTGGDYDSNWGIQIGMNVSDPPGDTIGQSYSKITFEYNADAVTPTNSGIRGMLHRKGDDVETSFCATVTSGTSATLTAFNTKCWDGSGDSLSEDDVANIDKIGIQISSDDKKAYEISDFCLTKIKFE